MKHTSHLYRMNPQAAQRPRRFPKLSTLLGAIAILSLAALSLIGRFAGH